MIEQKTVPCELCGTQTDYTGTKLCNPCWELNRRIRSNPDIARQILDDILDKRPRILYIRHDDGGYSSCIIRSVDAMKGELGWMDEDCAIADKTLTEWMSTCEIGDMFDWRMGCFVRLKDPA